MGDIFFLSVAWFKHHLHRLNVSGCVVLLSGYLLADTQVILALTMIWHAFSQQYFSESDHNVRQGDSQVVSWSTGQWKVFLEEH